MLMNKKYKEAEAPQGSGGWMVTFSDLITLLLTFFVLIICIANLDPKTLENAFGETTSNEGGGLLDYGLGRPSLQASSFVEELLRLPPGRELSASLKYALFQLEPPGRETPEIPGSLEEFPDPAKSLVYNRVMEGVAVSRDERGLAIKWDGAIIFPEGQAVVDPAAAELLRRLGPVLAEMSRPISIEAYTDPDSALEGGRGAAAFELAFRRARAVLGALAGPNLPPARFRLGGLGPNHPESPGYDYGPASASFRRRLEIVLPGPGPGDN